MVRDLFIALCYLLIYFAITLGISMFFAWWLCDIDPAKTYTWYSGIWQGMFFVPNLVRSWFSDALFKAESFTTAYNIFYWIFSILSVFGWIVKPFEILAGTSEGGETESAKIQETASKKVNEATTDAEPQSITGEEVAADAEPQETANDEVSKE